MGARGERDDATRKEEKEIKEGDEDHRSVLRGMLGRDQMHSMFEGHVG